MRYNKPLFLELGIIKSTKPGLLSIQIRALVSVGAVGAAAPTDFQRDLFCTH